ncbi:hypothetical protein K3N28_21110 [Glycomyces sp. TRM65418]|uniref:hypothetical protein n=1 Tax=Glycomyces sp. TRM65418 TaxID=2867006 RepID=UPI001CE5252A|nr:hypothetical protein [Glycomyces sp. TRM65418]MCC3765564.1 hypothetical protein [Glycomyces sp. TRM65418]QZD55167.1 hypothetical protein K3N28_21000 [Glycomyces sp. TRM65418]
MTYPSQPGYPTPHYGQPQPPRQNNLWLIGGAILVVLVVIMTVVLLVVQQTAGDDSAKGGDGSTTEGEPSGDASSDEETGGDGGDTEGGDVGPAEMTADACDAFDMSKFEEVFGEFREDDTYRSASNSNGLSSLSCSFYDDDFMYVNVYVSDYEDASDVQSWVESDADYYTAEEGYEFSEYTEIGDAGSYWTKDESGYKTLTLHIALGSLEVKLYTSLYDEENVDEAAAVETLADFAKQCETLFADYM